ncbi:MAG: hypothetical protein ACP5OJ_02250 [Methanothermobacter sp.]|jgi:hypothetical protein
MADVTIPDNIFYIIIAVIALVAIIVILMQWRKVREAQSNVEFLDKQAQLRKIELVEQDLESKRMMENVIPLPKEQQERLSNIRKGTSDLMQQTGFLHNEVNERVTRLEARTEYLKLQKLLLDIEKKEQELDKKSSKTIKSEDVQAVRGIKGGKP